jgi:hypothetical protein
MNLQQKVVASSVHLPYSSTLACDPSFCT